MAQKSDGDRLLEVSHTCNAGKGSLLTHALGDFTLDVMRTLEAR